MNPLHRGNRPAFLRRFMATRQPVDKSRAAAMADHPSSQPAQRHGLIVDGDLTCVCGTPIEPDCDVSRLSIHEAFERHLVDVGWMPDPITRIRRTCTVCFGERMVRNPNTGAEYPCACRTGLEKDRIERKAFG